MAQKTLQQQAESGGSFSAESYYGGWIAALANLYMPGRAEQQAGNSYAAFLNHVASQAAQFANTFSQYVYADTTDADAEFSVRAGDIAYNGQWLTYAGAVNQGPLVAGQDNHIWLDLSAAPTVTLAFGSAWPAAPHIRLATIAMPASGPWQLNQFTSRVGAQAIQVFGASAGSKRTDITYATSSPADLDTLPDNTIVGRLVVIVTTPFNGTAPTLTIGDSGDNDRLLEAADVDLKTANTYIIDKYHLYASQTDVKTYIAPDGSTAGEAIIILEKR